MPVGMRTIVCAAVTLSLASTSVLAGSVGLAWDAAAGAAGYKVHYGLGAGEYTNSVDVGNVTEVTVNGPADCATSYYAVTAYNAAGESPFSNEVATWPRPRFTRVTPSKAMQGDQVTLDVTGVNFQPGAAVAIDADNVFLDEVVVQSCQGIQIAATLEPTAQDVMPAEVGRFAVTVTNPDEHRVVASQAFEVLVNPARFDVIRGTGGPSDNRLDGRDALMLSRLFGSQFGDPIFDPDADFDGDGWVDGNDLAYLAGNLGKCWNGNGWSANACPQNLR